MEGRPSTYSSSLILVLAANIQLAVVSTKQPLRTNISRTYLILVRELGSHIRELAVR